MADYQLFIDGEYVDAQSGETFDTFDPATGQVIGTIAKAGREDSVKAIEAARKGGFVVSVDTDGDGRPDDSRSLTRAELDSAIPGLADVLDPSGTGGHNGTVSDTDSSGGDGRPVVDSNNNGVDDTVIVELAPGVQGLIVDVNEDGTPDVVMIDLDGNGKIDTMIKADGKGGFVIGYDDNEDGQVDRQEPITREQLDSAVPGLADVVDPPTGGGHNSTVSDGAVGSPSDPQELDTNKNGVTDAVAFRIAPGIQAVAVDPLPAQSRQHVMRAIAQRIGHDHVACELAVDPDRHQHRTRRQRRMVGSPGIDLSHHEAMSANDHSAALDHPSQPFTRRLPDLLGDG